jgi:rubrerythrin
MSLLHSDPEAQVRSLAELACLALALSTESQRRYARLAQATEGRTAAVFARLAEEEAAASESLRAWCSEVGAEPERRPVAMPPDIFRSWDELAESVLVSPYRALAAAVAARDRAFAYYSYLAARADEPSVRQAAERLASEELRHAARLRGERRQAWRRERPSTPPASTIKALMSQAAPLLAEAAEAHAGLAAALAAEGDARGAQALADLARIEAEEAGIALAPAAPMPAGERRRRAMAPLERLFELYEQAASHAPDEAVLAAAQTGLAVTVERMERLSAVASPADR